MPVERHADPIPDHAVQRADIRLTVVVDPPGLDVLGDLWCSA